jgi:hypothetical protein
MCRLKIVTLLDWFQFVFNSEKKHISLSVNNFFKSHFICNLYQYIQQIV